jgi:ABC-type branched-subunit amino acid transport system ATPase component
MPEKTHFQTENLTKSFGGLQAVKNLSFSMREREITSLIGPNGAGKTTVFNLISGLLKPDSGKIVFQEKDITGLAPHQIVNLGIARTFQDLRVFGKLTVRENILMGLRETSIQKFHHLLFGSGGSKKYLEEKINQLLTFVGLQNIADELTENISFPEQKLTILARALATGAKFLLLDEPTSGLAPVTVERMMDLIRQLLNEEKTVLLVEHNMDVVMDISHQVVVLNFGQKIAEGNPQEIRRNEEVIRVYLGI